MSHSGRLANKVAIVTGAGMGIGEGIARKFVFEGAKVVIFDIDGGQAAKVANSLPEGSAIAFKGDVTKRDDWDTAVLICLGKLGGLDICVNNAGVVHRSGPSIEVPESEYRRIMEINVSPLFHSAAAVQPIFMEQKTGGVFVNISSVSAMRPRPNLVWYAGSKGSVSAITKGLAAELAQYGIRANAINPVVADTGMVANVLGGVDTREGRELLTKGIPLGRFAQPADVANAACFLASEEASFITGIELPVDGGRALN